MPFDNQFRYFAALPAVFAQADQLRVTYGSEANTAPDHDGETVLTLVCGLDNSDTGNLRAMRLGIDAQPITLSDKRLCIGGYWSTGIINAIENGEIDGEELTEEQVRSLQSSFDI